MNLIFQIIIIAYLFLVVPFLFGILETVIFRNSQKMLSEILINGYLFMLAVFCVISVIAVRLQWTLQDLTKIWMIFAGIVSVTVFSLGFKQMKSFVTEVQMYWYKEAKTENVIVKSRYRILVILVVMLGVSVLLPGQSSEDCTLEIVDITVATNEMYQHDPYSGEVSNTAMGEHAYSAIEMLYAVGASLTGIEIPLMLYYLIPACILIYFYMGIWNLGNQLMDKEEKVIWFALFVAVIYWMTGYSERQSLLTGIYLNSWNGLTILSCMVMPVTFGYCMKWMKEAKEGCILINLMEIVFRIVIFVLAGQLTNAKGGFYIGLMLFVAFSVIGVRKGYDYVITSGCFKKRI